MFSSIALLALAAPLASALTLNIPTNPMSGSSVTITWTATSQDVPFSLFLQNIAFHNTFAIGNNVDPASQSLTLTIPSVPATDGYQLIATNPGNISDVFSSTGSFSIAQNPSSSVSVSATTVSQISLSSTGSSSAAATGSSASSITQSASSTSAFGSTITSSTAPASNTALSQSSSASGAATTTPLNSGALPARFTFMHSGVFAGMVVSVIAGAALLAL